MSSGDGKRKVAQIFVEQRVDFSNYVPEGFGTADCLIVSDKGIKVDAEMNPQLLCYALGALNMFGDLYEIEKISLFVIQPRMTSISDFEKCWSEKNFWRKNKMEILKEIFDELTDDNLFFVVQKIFFLIFWHTINKIRKNLKSGGRIEKRTT